MNTIDKIIQKVNLNFKEYIQKEQADIELLDTIAKTLKPFEGKVVTKRMETALKKSFPDHVVCFEDLVMYTNILIWKKNFENRKSFLLAYKENYNYSENTFREKNAWAGTAAQERIKDLKAITPKAIKKMANDIDNYNKAWKTIEKYYDLDCWYILKNNEIIKPYSRWEK